MDNITMDSLIAEHGRLKLINERLLLNHKKNCEDMADLRACMAKHIRDNVNERKVNHETN